MRLEAYHKKDAPDLPTLRSGGFWRSLGVSPLVEISSFSESLAPGLSNETNVTMSLTFMADFGFVGATALGGFVSHRPINGLAFDVPTLNGRSITLIDCDWFEVIRKLKVSKSVGAIFFRRKRFCLAAVVVIVELLLLLLLMLFELYFLMWLGSFANIEWSGADIARVSRGRISLREALFRRNSVRLASAVLGWFGMVALPLTLSPLLTIS